MAPYVVRRVAAVLPVWLVISVVAFLVATVPPGDPALAAARRLSAEPPTTAEVEELRRALRLDEPVPAQYLRWLGGAVRGDLGTSFRGDPVLPTLAGRFAVTLRLALPAIALSILIALPVGVVAAARRGSWPDAASRAAALLGASIPSYWLGYLLIIVFSVRLHLLPAGGAGGWRHAVLPAVTLSLGSGASLARLVRAGLLDALGEDYVRTALAKGLRRRAVLVAHALPNALLPALTVAGIRFGRLLAGTAIVETVFSWPGIGRYVVEAVHDRDYPAIQGFVLFTGTVFVLVNLAVDLLQVRLDPRVRLGRAS